MKKERLRAFFIGISRLRVCIALFFLLFLVFLSITDSNAAVRPPVQVAIGSTDELIVGKQMTVQVVIVGADLPDVKFEALLPPEGWQLVGGQVNWAGSLQAGQPVQFEFYVVPTVENPEPIRGRLSVQGWGDTEWFMDMNLKGPKTEDQSTIIPSTSSQEIGPLSTASVTARGRFVYVDDSGRTIGIRNARVRLFDTDWFFPCTPTLGVCRQLMGEGETDADGNFAVTGTGDDGGWDLPDPYVEVLAEHWAGNPYGAVVVQTAGLVNSTYCFKSGYKDNASDGAVIDFGTISPSDQGDPELYPSQGAGGCTAGEDVSGEHGAWQQYNMGVESWSFVRFFSLNNPGPSGVGEVPKVKVFWPDWDTFYRGPIWGWDDGAISIHSDGTWSEATIMHEYGHHVLTHFAESPIPDYNNGNCDDFQFLIFGGHCVWWSEKGYIHWTEGWPDYLSEVLTRYWQGVNGRDYDTFSEFYGPDPITEAPGSLETPPHPHPDTNYPMIEGYTAAVLWDQDLADANGDNHDGNNSRDNLSQGFEVQWDVLVNYDPDPISDHDHPSTIQEFCQGYSSRYPDLANRLAEIFDENHMTCNSGADLRVTSLSNPPASITQGGSFSATDTTTNFGDVRTGENSITRYFLSGDSSISTDDISIGERTVANLSPAGGSTGSATVTIPGWVPPGTYFVFACADAPSNIFESNEGNNCLFAAGQVVVGAPPVCSAHTYPTSKWQRVWYDYPSGNCLGDGPDETNEQFDSDWGSGVIAYGRSDYIQFTSAKAIYVFGGNYRITVGSDDGVRLWIDGVLKLDKWYDRPYTTDAVDVSLSAGNHDFRLAYYENEAGARVSFAIAQLQHTLTVTKAFTGSGTGTVTSNPPGINCGSDCTEYYDYGTVVTLTATPDAGSTFTGWSGACSGTGGCTVTMDAAKWVTASFATVCSAHTYPTSKWQRVWYDYYYYPLAVCLGDGPDETNEQFD